MTTELRCWPGRRSVLMNQNEEPVVTSEMDEAGPREARNAERRAAGSVVAEPSEATEADGCSEHKRTRNPPLNWFSCRADAWPYNDLRFCCGAAGKVPRPTLSRSYPGPAGEASAAPPAASAG